MFGSLAAQQRLHLGHVFRHVHSDAEAPGHEAGDGVSVFQGAQLFQLLKIGKRGRSQVAGRATEIRPVEVNHQGTLGEAANNEGKIAGGAGGDLRDRTPAPVEAYTREHRLYRRE